MWSVAVYDLHLTSDQFFALTPRQFDALVKRRERQVEHDEFMLAQLTAYTVNFSMCRPKDAVAPRDFMPSQMGKADPRNKKIRITKKRKQAITESIQSGFAFLRVRQEAKQGKV